MNKTLVAILLVAASQLVLQPSRSSGLDPKETSSAPFDPKETTVDHPSAQVLSFLVGHWLAKMPTDKTIELTWAPEHRGSMIGTQRTWESGKLKSYQFLLIREARFGPYMRINAFETTDLES